MSLDDVHDIDDISEITVRAMIDRLRRSTKEEQFIYRETELDEMWRGVDIALLGEAKPSAQWTRLTQIRGAIHQAHDLVGMDLKPLDAALALEKILPLLRAA